MLTIVAQTSRVEGVGSVTQLIYFKHGRMGKSAFFFVVAFNANCFFMAEIREHTFNQPQGSCWQHHTSQEIVVMGKQQYGQFLQINMKEK